MASALSYHVDGRKGEYLVDSRHFATVAKTSTTSGNHDLPLWGACYFSLSSSLPVVVIVDICLTVCRMG